MNPLTLCYKTSPYGASSWDCRSKELSYSLCLYTISYSASCWTVVAANAPSSMFAIPSDNDSDSRSMRETDRKEKRPMKSKLTLHKFFNDFL